MMEWRDEAAVLSMRPHGESAAIAEVFTRDNGRHLGVVRGGTSRRMAAHLQPGTQVSVVWTARLGEHLGSFRIEPIKSRGHLLSDPLALSALLSLCALLGRALPERAPHQGLWLKSCQMMDRLGAAGWTTDYLLWELALLQEAGFGLDLGACAVTGSAEDLRYVSPKTGRAVSLSGAGEWADRLLPLPQDLAALLQRDDNPPQPLTTAAILEGLALTGHFLPRACTEGHERATGLPAARGRFLDRLARQSL